LVGLAVLLAERLQAVCLASFGIAEGWARATRAGAASATLDLNATLRHEDDEDDEDDERYRRDDDNIHREFHAAPIHRDHLEGIDVALRKAIYKGCAVRCGGSGSAQPDHLPQVGERGFNQVPYLGQDVRGRKKNYDNSENHADDDPHHVAIAAASSQSHQPPPKIPGSILEKFSSELLKTSE